MSHILGGLGILHSACAAACHQGVGCLFQVLGPAARTWKRQPFPDDFIEGDGRTRPSGHHLSRGTIQNTTGFTGHVSIFFFFLWIT